MHLLLTDRFCDRAKSAGAQTDYFDETVSGLALRVSKHGVKAWSFVYTAPSGKRSRMTLGRYPATSLASARTLALEAREVVEAGKDPRGRSDAMTVAGLVDSYVEKHEIVVLDGEILDGRRRYAACLHLGRTVKTRQFEVSKDGKNPRDFVLSLNVHRRHLNSSQRAMIAAKYTNLSIGTNQHSKDKGPSIEEASKLLNVGHASVERALYVFRKGSPGLIASVEQGEISVSAAAEDIKNDWDNDEPFVGDTDEKSSESDNSHTSKNGKKSGAKPLTAFDRLDAAWDKADAEMRGAFVEANHRELESLVKAAGRKAKAA
jgi:Arm domain-containing DNA-binding protein